MMTAVVLFYDVRTQWRLWSWLFWTLYAVFTLALFLPSVGALVDLAWSRRPRLKSLHRKHR